MLFTYSNSGRHDDFISHFEIQARCFLHCQNYDYILAGGLCVGRAKGRSEGGMMVRSSHRRKVIKGDMRMGFYSYGFEEVATRIL